MGRRMSACRLMLQSPPWGTPEDKREERDGEEGRPALPAVTGSFYASTRLPPTSV